MKRLILCLLLCLSLPLMDSLGVSANGQTTNTQSRSDAEKRERERVEKKRYDEVCKIGTIEAYDNFLSLYPKSKYAADIIARKDDAIAFNKAKKINTKNAYDDYLNNSKLLIYASQAKKSISELVAESEWKKIENSLVIKEVETFMNKFPSSSYVKYANQRKKLILAINAYEQENYTLSLQLFKEIGKHIKLLPEQKQIYIRVAEEVAFSKLTPNSSQTEYKDFIDKYPKGKYASQVSNWRAIYYAKSLDVTSTEKSYALVRSYAKDDKTRDLVERYITNNEKNKAAYYKDLQKKKKEQEKEKRREAKKREREALKRLREINGDWKLINFGIGLFDLNSNFPIPYFDRETSPIFFAIHHASFPLSIKVGSNRSILQFEVGVKPGVIFSHVILDSDIQSIDPRETFKYKFHMPAFTRIKLSAPLSDSFNLYVSGFASYNKLVGGVPFETKFSAGGGVGFAWEHWDWTLLYYQQDIGDKNYQDNLIPHLDQILGTSLIYYF